MPLRFKEGGDDGVKERKDPVLHEPGESSRGFLKVLIVLFVGVALVVGIFFIYRSGLIQSDSNQMPSFTEPTKDVAVVRPESLTTKPIQINPPLDTALAPESTRQELNLKSIDSSGVASPQAKSDTVALSPLPVEEGKYTIFVARFRLKENAEQTARKWEGGSYKPEVTEREGWFRVSIGRFETRGKAKAAAEELGERLKAGYFVGRVKE